MIWSKLSLISLFLPFKCRLLLQCWWSSGRVFKTSDHLNTPFKQSQVVPSTTILMLIPSLDLSSSSLSLIYHCLRDTRFLHLLSQRNLKFSTNKTKLITITPWEILSSCIQHPFLFSSYIPTLSPLHMVLEGLIV